MESIMIRDAKPFALRTLALVAALSLLGAVPRAERVVLIGISVSAKAAVKIDDLSFAAIVRGPGARDVTPDDVRAVVDKIQATGIGAGAVRWWLQAGSKDRGEEWTFRSTVGIIMISLGNPHDAKDHAAAFAEKMVALDLHFSWNPYARIDCTAFSAAKRAALQAAARDRAALLESFYRLPARLGPFEPNALPDVDPYDPFGPIALCNGGEHPRIMHLSPNPGTPKILAVSYGRKVVGTAVLHMNLPSSNYAPPPQVAVPDARDEFSWGRFLFPQRITGSLNFSFGPNGRFVGTPGYAQVSAPLDAALLHFTYGPGWTEQLVAERVAMLTGKGIDRADITAEFPPNAVQPSVYVRILRPSDDRIKLVSETLATPPSTPEPAQPSSHPPFPAFFGPNEDEYRFLHDCSQYQRYALSLAFSESRSQARTIATAMLTSIALPFVQTDWAGGGSNVVCGLDGTGELSGLIATATAGVRYSADQTSRGTFWDDIYIAWALSGSPLPTIARHSSASALPFSVDGLSAHEYEGSFNPEPDAFAIQGWQSARTWSTQIVAAHEGQSADGIKADLPVRERTERSVTSVLTDCDASQLGALAAAVRTARADPSPLRWVVAGANMQFQSLVCEPQSSIGYSGAEMLFTPTNSPDGKPLVTGTITVYH
jgi:hypothetical protein